MISPAVVDDQLLLFCFADSCNLTFGCLASQEVGDLWLPLSGAEGEGKEGMIHVILSLTPIAPGAPLPQQPRTVPNLAAGGRPMTYSAQPQPASQEWNKQNRTCILKMFIPNPWLFPSSQDHESSVITIVNWMVFSD